MGRGNPNHDPKTGEFSSGGGGGGGMTGPSAHKSSYAPHAAMVKQMNSQQARAQAATRQASAVPTTHVHHSSGAGGYGADGNMTITRDAGRKASEAAGSMGGRGVLSGSPSSADRQYQKARAKEAVNSFNRSQAKRAKRAAIKRDGGY